MKFFQIAAAITLAAALPCALGEAAADRPLEVVLVTASRGEALLRELPLAISQRDREAIEAARPVFIGEVLNSVPGVHMTNLGNEQHSMSIRQPLSYNALYLYLLDGIPIRPLGLFNHNALYEINLAGVESIEVIRGPAASLYGSNSVGGTVNFLSRAPAQGHSAKLALQGSDQGYRRLDADASGRAGNLGLRASAYGSRRNGGWQRHNEAEKDAITLRADWAAASHTDLTAVLTHNALRTDMPGTLFASDYRRRPGQSYQRFTSRDVAASLLYLAASGDWWGSGPTTVTLYGRDNRTRQLPDYLIFNDPSDAGAASGRRNDNRFTSVGIDLRQQLHFDWLDSRLIVGLGGEQTRNDFREEQLSISRDPASGVYFDYTVAGLRRDYHVDLGNGALYAQLELSPLPALRLVTGARFDRIEYDYRNRLLPGATSGAPSERRHFDHVSPRLGLSWSPRASHTLFAGWAQGFTAPEVSALYGRLEVPALEESLFTNVELGWRARFEGVPLQLELALYQLSGRDEVINYRPAPGQSEPRNAGATRHRGVEFGLDWSPSPHWRLAVAGTWSRHQYRRFQIGPGLDFAGNEMPAAPRWLGTATLSWQPPALPGLTLALEGSWLDRYWMNDANSVRYPGHALLNLRAGYRRGPWQFWFKRQNLGDRRYAEVAASSFSGGGPRLPDRQDTFTPGAPRTLSVGVEYHWGEQ